MPLNQQHILTAITRSITIPVDVPVLQVMHTVELNLLSPPCPSDSSPLASTNALSAPYVPQMVTVGVALPAELVIRHSRNWDTSHAQGALEFYYEVQNSPDTWLVGGRKRAHFTGTADSVHRFPLILVPAKPGHLLLPNVDIKPVAASGGGGMGEDGAGLALETEYKANAHVVLVLPDVRATTVRIDSAYPGEA